MSAPHAVAYTSEIERHFTVKEIADAWKVSRDTVIRVFGDEPGVLRFGSEESRFKRGKITLRIPASVYDRVRRDRAAR